MSIVDDCSKLPCSFLSAARIPLTRALEHLNATWKIEEHDHVLYIHGESPRATFEITLERTGLFVFIVSSRSHQTEDIARRFFQYLQKLGVRFSSYNGFPFRLPVK